jgi:hypothetical protein
MTIAKLHISDYTVGRGTERPMTDILQGIWVWVRLVGALLLDGRQALDVVHLGLVFGLWDSSLDIVPRLVGVTIEQSVDVFEAGD